MAEKYNDKESKLFLATVYYDENAYYSERYEPNYEKAFKLFNELVEDFDNADAKFYLAEMYYCGKGTEIIMYGYK